MNQFLFSIKISSTGRLNNRILLLDCFPSTGELGAMIRTARCFGFDGIVVLDSNAPTVMSHTAAILMYNFRNI